MAKAEKPKKRTRSKGNFFLFKQKVVPGDPYDANPKDTVAWLSVGGPYSDTLTTHKEARKLGVKDSTLIGQEMQVMQIRGTIVLEATTTVTVKAPPKKKKEK